MDIFDARILNIVQTNNRATAEEIGSDVGLSASAVLKRLKKLRDAKIIEAEVAILSPKFFGKKLMVIVQIELERDNWNTIQAFRSSLISSQEVMQCYYVTGHVDFIIIGSFKDMDDYNNFVEKYFTGNDQVRRFNTSIVMNRSKIGLMIPITSDLIDE